MPWYLQPNGPTKSPVLRRESLLHFAILLCHSVTRRARRCRMLDT